MNDVGNRKATIVGIVCTGLLAAGQYIPALVLAVTYLGVNALLHLVGADGVDDGGEDEPTEAE